MKLMAAVGAAAGWENWLGILVLTSVAGAVAGLLLVAFKGRLRKTLGNLGIIITSLGRGRAPYKETPELDVTSDKALRLPHGALIALGTLGFLAAALRWGSCKLELAANRPRTHLGNGPPATVTRHPN